MAKKKKIFILDTNVLLHDYKSLYNFQENDIIIPIVVLEELDKFKKGNNLINFHAREFTRELDKLSGDQLFTDGISLGKKSGKLFIETGKEFSKTVSESFPEKTPDHRILAIADFIRKNNTEKNVALITKDINLRMKAKSLGIQAQDYETDKVANIDDLYKGITTLENLDSDLISKLYKNNEGIPVQEFTEIKKPRPHQYFILKSDKSSALAHYNPSNNFINRIEK
ncbi:MAG: ribonuclease, partial [Bacteroidales bacterium]|nr:ribonuclease [Bacteroidales bacterium]